MVTFKAKVFSVNHWEEDKYPENVQVILTTPDNKKIKVNCRQIPSDRAAFLMSLAAGEIVVVERKKNPLHSKDKKIPEFYYDVEPYNYILNLMRKLEEARGEPIGH